MNIIQVEKDKFDINNFFYACLKVLNSNDGLTDKQLIQTFEILNKTKDYQAFLTSFDTIVLSKIKSVQKRIILDKLLKKINSEVNYKVFIFANYILKFKPLLMEYSKLIEVNSLLDDAFLLSLKRDNETKFIPYAFRVNGALISLIFFDYIQKREKENFPTSEYTETFIDKLFDLYKELKSLGLEANQIFTIILQESISQSIKSTAGSSLEDYVVTILSNENIKNITKKIDTANHEIEYDHFFTLNKKKYGISTKRTLRERYKQFKKSTTAEADVFIHITSGLDLNEQKAKTITSPSFGCYIFVFPEIYEKTPYMFENSRIFSTKDLKIEILEQLI